METKDIYYFLQNWLGCYPSVYFRLFARKYPFNRVKVRPDSDICIEGFPRSANSYAVVAFRLANPQAKIAHHLHVPAQLLQARKWEIPAILLIREPEQAVASFLVFQNSNNADWYLKAYIRFHRALLSVQNDLVIADFNVAVQNINALIRAANAKFNQQFQYLDNPSGREEEIFVKLKEVNDRFFAGQRNKSMYPDEHRRQAKEQARQRVQQSPYLKMAQEYYRRFLEQGIRE